MTTLAERRARSAGGVQLPKSTVTVTFIEGQHLLAEAAALWEERGDLLRQAARTTSEGAESTSPRKTSAKSTPPRVSEIDARLDALDEALLEHQAAADLNGMTGGEWQRYKDDHPPREDNDADWRLAGGWCNASDLFADLGRFVVAIDGEALTGDDWDKWLGETICYADRRDLVTAVVNLHEQSVPRVPKALSSSSIGSDETA